jgi:XRE family aerobic/anaerobic benzoate catabolism transcriptional regulator
LISTQIQHYSSYSMDPLLRELGLRVRRARAAKSFTIKDLADATGLSSRFLGQLEGGEGNISVLKLARVAQVLGTTPDALLRPLRRLIALVGLRGAGKSTVGAALAERTGRPFVELDREVERRAGLSLSELFALHGEPYYRRLERATLRELLGNVPSGESGPILAAGGSLVTDPETWSLLREQAVTVWLRARPEDHLRRVAEQGDRRPMAGRADALADIARLLEARGPLYAEADLTVETSGVPVEETVSAIARGVAIEERAPVATAR